MVGLTNKLGLFREDGGSNIEIRMEGKSTNQEELKREYKK